MDVQYEILNQDCLEWLSTYDNSDIHLTFIDPPFRQGKDYKFFDDNQPEEKYWAWMRDVLSRVYDVTDEGGAVYFMQREKNTESVLTTLRKTGWKFQNLIVWKKKTSAVPSKYRYSKQYQVIAYATKGKKPRVFNKLRVDPPIPPGYKYERPNGIYLTDVWDDIRELTSGYFAADEPIRDRGGERSHTQQSPIALLLRIILTSTAPGDLVLDPFAGTGTTSIVSQQLQRSSISVEIDPNNVNIIKNRLNDLRPPDDILKYQKYYRYSQNLKAIWPSYKPIQLPKQSSLF